MIINNICHMVSREAVRFEEDLVIDRDGIIFSFGFQLAPIPANMN